MANLIELTQLSPTMSAGTFVRWTKQKGDAVEPGDVIAEVETDKAVMEMEALDSGILLATLAEEGDQVPVGAPLGILGEVGEEISEILEKAKKDLEKARQSGGAEESTSSDGDSASQDGAAQDNQQETSSTSQAQDGGGSSPDSSSQGKEASQSSGTSSSASPATRSSSGRRAASVKVSSAENPILNAPAQNGLIALPSHQILYKASKQGFRATPLARKVAAENKIDLSVVEPTGRGGTISEDDVRKAMKMRPVAGAGIEVRPDRKVQLSNMRRVIADRLHDAKNNIPHFYLTVEYNAGALYDLRKNLNADLAAVAGEESHRFSMNDLITRAVALSLQRHPVVNSSWRNDHVLERGSIDVGIAVAIDGGLITPYVRNADQVSMMQLSKTAADLVERARSRKLKPEEFSNGTFTISNLGMFGIKEFSAIINEPEAALLAVGGLFDKPVVSEGNIIIEKTITMTLSCDHRVIDGAEGARFLQTLKGFIENPYTLIVGS